MISPGLSQSAYLNNVYALIDQVLQHAHYQVFMAARHVVPMEFEP
jgi:hypothetical protein